MLRYVGEEVERVKGLFDEKERRLVGDAQAAAGAAAKEVPAPVQLQCPRSCHAGLRGKCDQLWQARQVHAQCSVCTWLFTTINSARSMMMPEGPTHVLACLSTGCRSTGGAQGCRGRGHCRPTRGGRPG